MKNIKLCWVLVVILLVALGFLGKKVVSGNLVASDDHRKAVLVSKDERNFLLKEMRDWLISVQNVMAATLANDLDKAEELARAAGMAVEVGTPGGMLLKIPMPMKKLGHATRARFDLIADDLAKLKDREHALKQLNDTMNNCIACHETYSFVAESAQ